MTTARCPECGRAQDHDLDDVLYQCQDCLDLFTRDESADGDSNRCPSCNRFASRAGTRCECGTDVLPEPEPEPEPEPCRIEFRVLANPIPLRTPSRRYPDRTHVVVEYECPFNAGGETDPAWRDRVADQTWTCLTGTPCLKHGATVTITDETVTSDGAQ